MRNLKPTRYRLAGSKENAYWDLAKSEVLFYGGISSVENSLLYKAAETWCRLCNFCYRLTYGFKMNLYTINLSFSPSDFPHLAGFQYLKDIALPRYAPAKHAARILEGKITQGQIEKSACYKNMVEPRLLAVASLEGMFDNEFVLYSFTAKFCPFKTRINADYLISGNTNGTSFVFLMRTNEDKFIHDCVCSSAFLKDAREFSTNQRLCSLLKKSKTCLADESEETLFQKLKKDFTKESSHIISAKSDPEKSEI